MYTVGSSVTEAVDSTFVFIVAISLILLIGITAIMIYFAIKYSKKNNPVPKKVKEHLWVEITWTLIPVLIVLAMFWSGYKGFKLLREVPEDSMKIKVFGKMWEWNFIYDNGKETKELFVPVGQNVKLIMRSVDVVHSLYIPAFRIKEDVIPGRDTFLWFKPQGLGPADIFCAEFCGQRHAYMLSKVNVMSRENFNKWYNSGITPETGAKNESEPGFVLMKKKGCLECHTTRGSKGNRISLTGIFGKDRIVIRNGKEISVKANKEYLKNSLLNPTFDKLKGHAIAMKEIKDLKKKEVELIVNYLKELK